MQEIWHVKTNNEHYFHSSKAHVIASIYTTWDKIEIGLHVYLRLIEVYEQDKLVLVATLISILDRPKHY